MKKILFCFVAVLLATGLGFSSCSSNDDNNDDTTKPTTSTFAAAGKWWTPFDSTTITITQTANNYGTFVYSQVKNGQTTSQTGTCTYSQFTKKGILSGSNGSSLFFNFYLVPSDNNTYAFVLESGDNNIMMSKIQ